MEQPLHCIFHLAFTEEQEKELSRIKTAIELLIGAIEGRTSSRLRLSIVDAAKYGPPPSFHTFLPMGEFRRIVEEHAFTGAGDGGNSEQIIRDTTKIMGISVEKESPPKKK